MAIIIPSKNIYNNKNTKILQNQIFGIEASLVDSNIEHEEIEAYNQEQNTPKGVGVSLVQRYDNSGNVIGITISKNDIIQYKNITTISGSSTTTRYDTFWQKWNFTITSDNGFPLIDETQNIEKQLKKFNDKIILSVSQYTNGINANYSDKTDYPKTENIEYSYRFDDKSERYGLLPITTEINNANLLNILLQYNDGIARTTPFYYAFIKFKSATKFSISFDVLYNLGIAVVENNTFKEAYVVTTHTPTIKLKDFELTKGEYIYKSSENKTFKINNNELLQKSNTTNTENPYFNLFSQKLVSNWTNGKETATILCSIADYYDSETGEKVIAIDNSTGKMLFDIDDEIVPMVYGSNGSDSPMSLGNAGQAKVFKVIGVKPYYDGAVWQELSLQETDTIYYEPSNKTLADLSSYTLLSLANEKLVNI